MPGPHRTWRSPQSYGKHDSYKHDSNQVIRSKDVEIGSHDKLDDQLTTLTWDDDDLYGLFTDDEENESIGSIFDEPPQKQDHPQQINDVKQVMNPMNTSTIASSDHHQGDVKAEENIMDTFLFARRAPFLLENKEIEQVVERRPQPQCKKNVRKPPGSVKNRDRPIEVSELPSWRREENNMPNARYKETRLDYYRRQMKRTMRRPAVPMRSRIEQWQHRLVSSNKLASILEEYHDKLSSSETTKQKFRARIPSVVEVPSKGYFAS